MEKMMIGGMIIGFILGISGICVYDFNTNAIDIKGGLTVISVLSLWIVIFLSFNNNK